MLVVQLQSCGWEMGSRKDASEHGNVTCLSEIQQSGALGGVSSSLWAHSVFNQALFGSGWDLLTAQSHQRQPSIDTLCRWM